MRPTQIGGPTLRVNPSGGGPKDATWVEDDASPAQSTALQQVASNKQQATSKQQRTIQLQVRKFLTGRESLASGQVGLEWDSPRSADVGPPLQD